VLIWISRAAFEANTIKSPQKMFSWMRSADHQGRRTIGIMTKCDELGPGLLKKTAKEMFAPVCFAMSGGPVHTTFINNLEQTQPESISNNRFIPACGSYGVRNKTTWDSILYTSLEGVHEREAALFGRKDWCSNASDWQIRLGIHELVLGLNKIFANHVRTQYASVAAEIRVILAQRRERLNLLGPVNKTIVEQREYLRSVVTNSHVAILRCLHDDSNLIIPNGPDLLPGKRIALQKIAFENLLSAKEGHFAFHSATGESDFASGHAASAVVTPQDQTGDIYTWINRRYQSMKGSTLPGVVPYPLIDSLFQEQTANWKAITTEFVDSIENILLKTAQQCLGDTCHNKAVLARLTELALQRTTVKIDLWRKSCHSILQNGQQRLDLLSHESEFIQEVNTARTLRFLSALTSMESVDEALDIPVAPVFGPLLRTKKPVRPQSKSESPASSLSSGSSPRTPQSIRSYDVFDDDPLYDSDANEEPDSEWKIFNLDDNKRNWDSPHFRMRCLKVRPLRISSWTSTAGTEYIRRAQDFITNDRQVVYQIHDILKAYYNISLRNYIASIFKTLQSDLSEVVGSFSEFVDSLSDEKISRLFEESDVDKRARKSLEEDIQRLQLAVLEAEVILTEPTSGSSSNQSHPRDE
jgi:Dynamin central region